MMKLYVCLTWIAFNLFSSLNAQNYRPFHPLRTYEYATGATGIEVMRTGSMGYDGVDSVLQFAPAAIATDIPPMWVDSCIYMDWWTSALYNTNRDCRAGSVMKIKSGGKYEFVSSEGNVFHIETQLPVSSIWTFTGSVTATFTGVSMGTVMGLPDSLMHISLSDGNEIVISKNYGLAESPDFREYAMPLTTSADGVLRGIRESGPGEALPTFEEVFDFDIGDQFDFHTLTMYMTWSNTWERLKVFAKYESPLSDSFHYSMQRTSLYIQTFPTPVYLYVPLDTVEIFYRKSDYDFLDYVSLGYTSVPGTVTPRFESAEVVPPWSGRERLHFFHDLYLDSCDLFINTIIDGGTTREFTDGLGMTYESYSALSDRTYQLVCYKKATDSAGTCINFDSLLAVSAPEAPEFEVYPNPASVSVFVSPGGQPGGDALIELTEISGRVVRKWNHFFSAAGEKAQLDLTGIVPGMYLLHIMQNGKTAVRRLGVHQ